MRGTNGADTPDEVIEQYVSALESNDPEMIARLIPKGYTSDSSIEDKLSQFGGYDIEEYEVEFSELKPSFLTARLSGRYTVADEKNQNFEDTLTVAYEKSSSFQLDKGNWYLLLGDGNASPPNVQPANP